VVCTDEELSCYDLDTLEKVEVLASKEDSSTFSLKGM
jgi:hypothetical protein